ncbi:UNVERIFIED_CONTAM: hypothetical protein OHV15_14570 [Microbacterium sp. SLM126]
MTLFSRLVKSPGLWLAPLALVILVSRIQGVEESGEGYHTAVVLMDVSGVTFIAPLVALVAAWEGSKLRYARVLTMPRVRSVWQVACGPIAVSVVPAAAVLVLFTAFDGPASGMDWAFIAGGVFTLVAWAVAGFGLGCLLLPVVSLPVAFLVSALWLILARANEPLWLRHLTGAWTGCCFMNQTLDPAALWASVITNAGIAIAGGLLTWAATLRVRRPAVVRGAAVLAIGTIALFGLSGAVLVLGFGCSPAQARSDATECDGGSPELCLWAEHRGINSGVRSTLDEAVHAWSTVGLSVPSRFDEGLTTPVDAAVPLIVSERGDANDWISSLSSAMLASGCGPENGAQAGATFDADAAWTWLVITAGADAESTYPKVSPPAAERAAELLQDPGAAAWVEDVIADLRSCR